MRRELWADGADLSYEWEKKRVKNLNLRVHSDGSIHVSSAGWVPAAVVDDFVRSRVGMIQKARRRWQNERPGEALAVEDGAVLPCMGRAMTLVLQRGSSKQAAAAGGPSGADAARSDRQESGGTSFCRVVAKNLRGDLCSGTGAMVSLLCPMGDPEAGAAPPPHEKPLGKLPARNSGYYDERATAARPAGVYRVHHGA